MGYIKEPKGVDFFIKSDPLDDKARKEISEYIRAYKAKQNTGKGTVATSKTATKIGKTATVAKKGTKSRIKASK